MQQANSLINQALNSSTTNQQAGSTATKADAVLVNKIFQRLTLKCTAWKQAVTGDLRAWEGGYKRELLAALIRHRVCDWRLIECGIAMVTSDFLPNQDRFAMNCKPRPEDVGLPSVDAAYREATNNIGRFPEWRKWTHPAIYQAVCDVGFAVLKTSDERQSRPLFEKAYEAVCWRVMAGEKLQLPEEERLEKTEKRCTKQENRAHCANLKASLGF